jgi:hypothetical protein
LAASATFSIDSYHHKIRSGKSSPLFPP